MDYDCEVTILRCRGRGIFYLALLCRAFIDWQYADKQFDLHVDNSKTLSWSTKSMHVVDSPPKDVKYFSMDNVITIGGEGCSVGWVDLSRGILICDLLEDNQHLRYIPLPSPLGGKPLRGYPMYNRNIIVLDGYIKYFEMRNHVQPASDTGKTCISECLVAATKKMETSSIGSGNSYWEEDCAIESSEVPRNSLLYAQMLPPEGADTKPTSKIHYRNPRLCLEFVSVPRAK
jgi:hypothetical protein